MTPVTIGIEEEYLLVDAGTGALAASPPDGFMEDCRDALGKKVTHEFLQAQVEIGTGVCATIDEARAELVHLRRTVAGAARAHGMRLMAASTHPWSRWADQERTDMERYRILAHEHRALVRRMAICGMHVHAGIKDRDERIAVMNGAAYFLPHLLALSASSPFWEGRDTGLRAFRPVIIGDLPRSGFPEPLERWSDWTDLVEDLAATGMLDDPSKIWWDIRPSIRHPTVEMRVCDVCTDVEDALSVAALFQSIVGYLRALRGRNEGRRRFRTLLLAENKWRAMRSGVNCEMADWGRREARPFAGLVDELVELVRPHAEAAGCVREVERCRDIAARGTSADAQRRIFTEATERGADEREAQRAVVDWIVETTEPPAPD
ncbi:carboxylate-amine ligase [Jannaschia sp. W003]|uniref:carboxylate-amine ligase n=1 Tax=Jannaschia sp. W003 TaxID=2867012 RepID=UPI0021A5D52C|nr:carboxylate-amine ligase [Jannaschia sp. W003]UWQ20430.1 carboxylate-amine ligase [Jannaschia sp. W003]